MRNAQVVYLAKCSRFRSQSPRSAPTSCYVGHDSCGPVDSERKQPYSAFSGKKRRAASLNNLGVLFPLLSSSNHRLLFKPSSLHHITQSSAAPPNQPGTIHIARVCLSHRTYAKASAAATCYTTQSGPYRQRPHSAPLTRGRK